MTSASAADSCYEIVLPVYNGALFLAEQLESIAAQTDYNWHITLSDDGSTDGSVAIIEAFQKAHPAQVSVQSGPKQGLTRHVIDLLHAVPKGAGPVALSDQDDIWFEDRIASDRAALSALECDGTDAVLLCRRTQLSDEHGRPIRLSPARPRPPTFQNALVQNIASGNTMVLNRALLETVRTTSDAAAGCAFHDWWLYQVVTATGGQVIHLDAPKMFYRQHQSNVVGVPMGLLGAFTRVRRVFGSSWAKDAAAHLQALEQVREHLTPAAQQQLASFRAATKSSGVARLRHLAASGVYRQSRPETALLWLAVVRGLI